MIKSKKGIIDIKGSSDEILLDFCCIVDALKSVDVSKDDIEKGFHLFFSRGLNLEEEYKKFMKARETS